MGKAYCSIEDVLSVATTFRKDVVPDPYITGYDQSVYTPNTNTIPREDVEDIIFEASEQVRLVLSPRYTVETIDSYEPNYPPLIVYLTKVYAAIMMHERYSAQSTDQNMKIIERLYRLKRDYEKFIISGDMLNNSGEYVSKKDLLTFKKSTSTNSPNVQLEELYENGNRTY